MAKRELRIQADDVLETDYVYTSDCLRKIADQMDAAGFKSVELEEECDYSYTEVNCYIVRDETDTEERVRRQAARTAQEAKERRAIDSKKRLIKEAKAAGITAEDLR